MQKVTPAFKNSGSSPNLNLRCFPLPGLVFTLELFPIHTKYVFLAFVFVSFYCLCLCLLCLSYQRPAAGVPLPRFSSTHARPNQFQIAQLENEKVLQIMTVLNFDKIQASRDVDAGDGVGHYFILGNQSLLGEVSKQCCSG